jgi:diadenylate cyclase
MLTKLIQLISSIRWQDIVDISLNSYILFRVYVLFKGTNVFRVLIGMTVLWFFQRFAASLGLVVTSWVLQAIAAVAALIIIVVFRNEIRSVLQAKNLKSILWGFSAKTQSTPTEIVVDSVFEMARRRCGALLVIPGKEDLSEIIQSGITWKGLASKEMIMSVFWPDNPVHDGAAILQGDQIAMVSAILPLSHRDDLPSNYGTRHRAALGLAEVCDALIIVVSEERGEVVVAKDSRLRVVNQERKLEQILQVHLGRVFYRRRVRIRERLETATAALVSLVFITGVWFSVTRGEDTLVSLDIPVEYMNRDPGMEIVNTSVDSVKLGLIGSGALIKSIRPEQVHVRLDLSKSVVGSNSFTITGDNISLPPGIVLKDVEPQVLDVTMDIMAKKELPVQVDWVGKLPDELILPEIRLEPSTVQVVGGKQILEGITTIYTEKVPLDQLRGTGSLSVNLALNPASLKIASGSKPKITIKFRTEKRQ